MANAASSITTGLEIILDNPTEIIQFLAVQLPPQSTFYIQVSSGTCEDVALFFDTVFVLMAAATCVQLAMIQCDLWLGV